MFRITLRKITNKGYPIRYIEYVDTLAEAEILAKNRVETVFGIREPELVYVDDLDYHIHNEGLHIGRLSIKPIYVKRKVS